MAKILVTKVAGVTYEGRQEYIDQMTLDTPIRIVPEPHNPYDANALAVHAALAEKAIVHVGYIPRDMAARVAPYLDGEQIMAKVREITGGFEMWDGTLAAMGLLIEIELPDEAAV